VGQRDPSGTARRRLATGAGLLALMLPWLAFAEQGGSRADLTALMGLLAARKHGHVSYVEEHFIGTLERPLKSSGELLYEAPDHLEKRTLRPRAEILVLEHGIITAQRGRHTYVLSLQDYPQVVPLIDSIRATLAGDLPALERIFTVGLRGSLDAWHLSLAPREASVAKSIRQIEIEGSRASIRSVEIRQKDGDRSLLSIGEEIP
jgi:hypothetical protein